LGSNLGKPYDNLMLAIDHLQGKYGKNILLDDIKLSKIYQSKAIVTDEAPNHWRDLDYLNIAIMGETEYSPHDLLAEIKQIEQIIGRDLNSAKWAPREIDIDILLYDDLILSDDILQIPHKMLLKRDFALKPLVDLIPQQKFHLPNEFYNKSYRDIYDILFDNDNLTIYNRKL
ncbi:MAG: 2-amino-4-hydroxy-6-hydroxymethyldihydropteridine diphosphokinase, partial [Pseudomonadota bacterium]